MAGSSLQFNLPSMEALQHNNLTNRNLSFQHALQAIYRESDGKDLETILNEIQEANSSVKYQFIPITADGTTIIDITAFSYNMSRDELFVDLCGVGAIEGTEYDYVKLSPTQIQFNYPLKKGYEVLVVLAGTISNISFGDDIYTALHKFTQLTDTPDTYHGFEGKYPKVNDSGTGLVFDNAIANTELKKIEYTSSIEANSYSEGWVPFVHKGIIKGIKVTGNELTEQFNLSIWTKISGYWVYYSGDVSNILWDIMDIPFIDESGADSIFVRLNNSGPKSDFTIQIYVVL